MVVTAVAGAAGALGAIAIGGKGTYDVAPFTMEFRAWPAAAGKTQFAVDPTGGLSAGHAEAGTHRAPMVFRATITGFISPTTLRLGGKLPDLSSSDRASLNNPRAFADFLGASAKDAARAFAIKVGLIGIGGAAVAGLLVSLAGLRFGRIAGAVLVGLLSLGGIGLLVQQTFDANQFSKTCWQAEGSASCTRIVPS